MPGLPNVPAIAAQGMASARRTLLARYATGGTGLYKGSIDWFEWGTNLQQIPAGGLTRTNTRVVAGQTLATTCTVGAPSGGTLVAYKSGNFSGDGLDNLYNIGGTGAANQMIAGLANLTLGDQISFHLDCSVTLNGVPVPLAGLVMADAEASDQATNEFVQATIPAGGDWRLIDRYRAGCALSTPATRNGQTLRLGGVVPGCTTYPTTVAFMEDATSANVVIHGGGRSAVALGVMLFSDFGDAPASYGDAGALYSPSFSGGLFPQGAASVFSMGMGTPGQPATRLGASVDAESAEQPSPDAAADAGDNGVTPPSTLGVRAGDPYTLPAVTCAGPGFVNGWIDWNDNGAFDPGEVSGSAQCVGGAATLNWTVPGDVQAGDTFLRLRIGPTAASVTGATGMTTAGEVEDYAVTVAIPAPFSCGTNAPGLLYQSPGPTLTNRYAVDLVTGSYPTPQQIPDRQLNAVGYNTADDFIYGWDVASDQIVRIGSDGTVQELGAPAGMSAAMVDLGFAVGDVDDNNHYWVSRTDTGQWFEIDLATNTVIASGTALSSVNASGVDWAYLPGTNKLWRVASNAGGTASFLTGFDRTTHTWTTPVALGDVSDNVTGAIFADAAGFLYSSFNNTGDIWRIDPVAGTATKFSDGPAAPGNDGARCVDSPILIDFGDAPNGYLTNLAVDGPRHGIKNFDDATNSAPLMLGSTIDPENDGQPGAGATGDGADEDGVSGPITIPVGGSGTISVTATNNTAQVATLAGWVDLNDNGTFEASERVTVSVPANSGTASYDLTFPAATGGDTYARFRLFPGTVAAPLPTGPAAAGEVEDYAVTVTPPTPFTCGSNAPGLLFQHVAPNLPPTTLRSVDMVTGDFSNAFTITDRGINAAGYNVLDDYVYGWDLTNGVIVRVGGDGGVQELGVPTGQVGVPGAIMGDIDNLGHYWYVETGAGRWHEVDLVPGSPTYMDVIATGVISPWPTGPDWAYIPGTNFLYSVGLVAGVDHLFSFNRTTHAMVDRGSLGVGGAISSGAMYADAAGFLYTSNNSGGLIYRVDTTDVSAELFASGPASSGNDGARCASSPIYLDFGDAPNGYKTNLGADGPRHGVPDFDDADNTAPLMLGASIDPEDNGQPGAGATGDGADEDGVSGPIAMTVGQSGTISVSATNNTDQPATLAGWVDLNDDGTFQASERVTVAVPANSGTASYDLAFPAPTGADTYARFRLFPGTVANPLPTGPASAGEVEDYPVTVAPPPPFSCTSNAPGYLTQNDGVNPPTDVYAVDMVTGASSSLFALPGVRVNAAGYNPLDDYVYAFNAGGGVVRVGSDGSTQLLGMPANWGSFPVLSGLTFNVGDVAADGTYWIAYGNDAAQLTWAQIDLRPGSPTYLQVLQAGQSAKPVAGRTVADWAFNPVDGKFYTVADNLGVDNNKRLWSFDPATKVIAEVANLGSFGDAATAHGAQYTDANGFLYISENSTGTIRRVDLGTHAVVVFSQGPAAGNNDGARCYLSPILIDLGDAPDSYKTTLAADGPRHGIPGYDDADDTAPLMLGATIDPEDDGQPGAGANGDGSDEDGVAAPITMTTGDPVTVTVSATNDTDQVATLAGWIDLNGDGTFQAGERVTATVPANSGTGSYQLTFPAGTTTSDTYARFRLFPGTVATPLPTGPASAGEVEDYPVTLLNRELDIEKTSSATPDSRPGDTITYTVTATNTGNGDFTAANPARVRDSLAGVLDDATYNDDAAASTGPDPAYAQPVISWNGPLDAGDSVTITYTVTLKGGGDGRVRNVAFAQCDPADTDCDPAVPVCDPPDGDGLDPATGKPCAESELLLPKLTIVKAADRTDLPAIGQTVTYTVTVKNEGPGDTTAAEPATFTDDLADVLDANTSDPNGITASVGSASFTTPTLSWSGVLAAGDTATISYTVTYLGGGDQQLTNNACVPADEAQDPQDPCAHVQIPGSGLDHDKVSSPASGTPVEVGQTITYTLRFTNTGPIPAAVNTYDDVSGVLDDADLVLPSIDADTGLVATYDAGNQRIDVTGTVPVGQSLEVTYQVVVKAFAGQGDHVLRNALQCEPGDPQPCAPEETEHPVRALDIEKTSNRTSATVVGDTVTYTVTATNIGEAAYTAVDPALVRDDLAGVLDDADYNDDAQADLPGSLTYNAPVIRWEGALGVGQTVTVTYTVTLKSGGDLNVRNVAWGGPGTAPECDPPTADGVDSDTGQPCDEDEFGLPRLVDSKSVDPDDGTAVKAGDELTYTLTFSNTGTAAGAVSKDDYVGMLLDDATITDGPNVSDAALTASVNGNRIEVRGTLAAGQTVTVSYTITVKPDAARVADGGDDQLGNFLIDPSDTPPTQCLPEADEDATCNPVARIVDSKSVDPADGSAVKAGDELAYTLTFTNLGKGAGDVTRDDYIGMLLDDATITDGPDVSDPALTATVNGNRIEIRGTLAAGQTVTVTYVATVKSDADRVNDGGDDQIGNFLIDPADEPPTECAPAADEDATCNPVARIVDSKSVDPADGTAVKAGDELTYTLTFHNAGQGAGAVSRDDYVGMLLDDATITDGPNASDPALTATLNGDRIEVRGTLAGDQTVTVTYTITVKSDADRVADGGDDQLGNFLIDPDDEPPTECAPTADEDATCNPVARIVDSKSVDPADGTAVKAGDELTYTLTFANLGKGSGEVSRDDYVGMLLDDATVTDGPNVSDPALTATLNGDRIEVRGVLEGGQTVTITYTVTVKQNGGDYQLGNFLIDPDGTPPSECAPTADEDATCNPVPHVVDSKSVSPKSGTAVGAGGQLTYTLAFRNDGKAAGEVNRVDDLSGVLDDADLVDGPNVTDAALTVTGPADGKLSIAGTLAAGQEVLVTYTVRVKPRDEQGDQELGNWLLDSDEEPPAGCEPSEDSTCNPVSDIVASKTVDPDDGSEVEPGEVLTYTLTFTNEGKGIGEVDYVDKMAGILDDATLVSGPESSDPALEATGGDDGKIKVTGELDSGQTVTVSYSVKVKAFADQGDHQLANFLVAPGVAPPTCLPDDPMCTENAVASPESALPNTGGPSRVPLGLGLLLVMMGAVLVSRSRGRRRVGRAS